MISVVAKVFERIVYDQLYPCLEEHDIICKYQSGFHAIHSTVTALLEATDTWTYNIARGKINAVNKQIWLVVGAGLKPAGADPGFFFRRGCTRLLLYFNTNKPHGNFFLQNTSCIRKLQVISGGGGGGGCRPSAPSP